MLFMKAVSNHLASVSGPVMVTGATGLVGHALVCRLLEDGYVVHALVRNPLKAKFPASDHLRIFLGDITNPGEVARAMEGCAYVFHTAAMTKPATNDRQQMYSVNLEGTKNVLEAALLWGVRRLVFTSSCAVAGASYQRPLTEDDPRIEPFHLDYEASKKLAEDLVQAYRNKGLDCVIVSPTKIFGEGVPGHDISLNRIIAQFLRYHCIALPRRHFKVSVVYLPDVVEGLTRAMWQSPPNEKFFLSGHRIEQVALFKKIAAIAGFNALIIPVYQWMALLFGYCLKWKSLLTPGDSFNPNAVKALFHHYEYSSAKARRQLGLHFTSLDESLRRTIAFLQKGGDVPHIAVPGPKLVHHEMAN
jgi:nucleoside-diphosphate-sugar epimerase